MASSDYKLCDLCGAKTFYDANIEDERYRQTWGARSAYDPIGLKAICGTCNKTHEVIIVPRIATPDPLSDPRVHRRPAAQLRAGADIAGDVGMSEITTRRAIEVCLSRVPMRGDARDVLVCALQNEIERGPTPPAPMDADATRAALQAIYAVASGVDEGFSKRGLLGRLQTIREQIRNMGVMA